MNRSILLPASTDAESPSKHVIPVIIPGGGGGGGGVHKAKKILLHFSLNHGILSRMALFLEKLEFFAKLSPASTQPSLS